MNLISRHATGVALMAAAATSAVVADEGRGEWLDPIVITATPTGASLLEAFQSLTVIDRDWIESWPAPTLADLLAGVAGLDVQRRGEPGVQADIGIRGTGVEQTVVLLDGMPMGDPQAGHHNLNLPVPVEHIERIEVIKGPGAMAYGGNATGGVINVVTRSGSEASLSAQARIGSHDTRSGSLSAAGPWGESNHRVSVERLKTDGHLPAGRADADMVRGLYTGRAALGETRLRWGLGGENRDFGAWKFYTADFPDQRERTQTRSAWVSADASAGKWKVTPRLFWREHDDWFRTLVSGAAYINRHATRVQGMRVSARRRWAEGVTAVGAAYSRQQIDSNALDQHDRKEAQAWLVHRHPLGERAQIEAGLSLVDYSDHGRYGLPSLAVKYSLDEHWTSFASWGSSARVPSYTELFLDSSGNRGSATLGPERSDYAEIGLRYLSAAQRINLALFERRTGELIDWARRPGEVQWQARQFDGHRSRGAEVEWQWLPSGKWLERVDVATSVLDTRLDDRRLEIKYALDYVELGIIAGAVWRLGDALSLTTRARHSQRSSGETGTLLDLRLSWQLAEFKLFVEGNNLLDRRLVESGFAELPGRWCYAGVSVGW